MRPLSGLDAAFLYLETPNAPMNVTGTLVLDPSTAQQGCSGRHLLRLVEERLSGVPLLRRRLRTVPLGLEHPVWIEDPGFRLAHHLRRVRAPAPGGERALADLVARLASRPLDRARPLWELWVVEGLAEGRLALVLKVHHAAADGLSAAALLLRLLDPFPRAPGEEPPARAPRGAPAPGGAAVLADAAARMVQRPRRLARALRETARSALDIARSNLAVGATPGRAARPFGAPRTRFNGALSPRRAVAFGRARLADVKLVRSAFGGSVNDVVLAACARTLRHYLEARGELPAVPLVATVPVSVRAPEETGACGNRLSAWFVRLPVHLADPLEQLWAVQADCRESKRIHEQIGPRALGEWAELASPAVFAGGARLYSRLRLAERHRPIYNLVVSNLPGPQRPLYAAGAQVLAAYPLGPLAEGAGLNVTVVSYAGELHFGVIACQRSVPDPWELALGFGAAVGDLVKLALGPQRNAPSSFARMRVV